MLTWEACGESLKNPQKSEDGGREQTRKRFEDWTKDDVTHKE
jgi:hypothetical protein